MAENTISTSLQLQTLKGKIGWICHAIRWLVIFWLAWVLYLIVEPLWDLPHWVDQLNTSPALANAPVTIQTAMTSRLVILVDWLCATTIGIAAWRLTSTYLRGEIFSEHAAQRLRRLGQAALLATVADIVLRPVFQYLLSPALLIGKSPLAFFLPQDLLYLLISGFILSLAHIFRVAAEINAENKSFI